MDGKRVTGKVTSAKSRKESPDQYIDTTEVCVEGVWQEQTFSFAEIPTSNFGSSLSVLS